VPAHLQAVAGVVKEADTASVSRRPNSMIAVSIVRLLAFSWASTSKPSSRSALATARTSFTGLRNGVSR